MNVINGNVWFDQTDITLPGLVGLRLSRSYNSFLASNNVGGMFGRGWSHTYEENIAVLPYNVLKLLAADGSPIYFTAPVNSNTYAPLVPTTEQSTITSTGNGYTRTFRWGPVEKFDSQGRLLSYTDASGNVVTLARDPSTGRLLSITDPGTRSLSFDYDGNGHVTALNGPAGNIASYVYDPLGELEKVTYADATGYMFAYDSSARIISVKDLTGLTLETHTYDGQGRGLTSQLGSGQEQYTFSYSPAFTTMTDSLGNVTVYKWNSIQGITRRITEIDGPCPTCGGSGQVKQAWTYDSAGRVLSYTDGEGNTTTYTYFSNGDFQSATDPLGHTRSYTYDTQGRMLTRTAPDTGVTTYTYGPSGPLTIQDPIHRTTTVTYNASGNGISKPATIQDPRGKTTTLAYNSFADLTSVTDPLNHATTFGYDSMGRRTTVTDALNNTTTTSYDVRGRVTRITNPDSTHSDTAYDGSGRRMSVTDPLGNRTRYEYDNLGRLQAEIDALDGVTAYGYDAMSHLVSLTDAKGNKTAFSYTDYGLLSKVTYPGGGAETYASDWAGRLATKVDRKGTVTTYSYDTNNRLSGKSYSDGTPSVSYGYDNAGRMTSAVNGTDTLTWVYDLAGQLTSEASAFNSSVVSYTYDNNGNRATVSLNGTQFVSYGYDDASRFASITQGSNVFNIGYDNSNRRTSLTYPNGVSTAYSYDTLNRLTNLAATFGSNTITQWGYTYDNAGNRLTKTSPDYGETYTYDPLSRLTQAVRTTGSATNHWVWTYDAVGNRLTNQLDDTVTSSTYNNLNQIQIGAGGGPLVVRGHLNKAGTATVNGIQAQMTSGNTFQATIQTTPGVNTFRVIATDVSGNVTNQNYQVTLSGTADTYTEDADGNLTQKIEGSNTFVYAWDAENRLKSVTQNGTPIASFAYDVAGRRVQKIAAGLTTTFLYDGSKILQQTSGGTSLRFVHGPESDEPLANLPSSGGLSFYHADGLGSIVKNTNTVGTITSTFQYDAWGHIQSGSSQGGFSFTGRESDPETGLYYYRARYYDSTSARFLSEDPARFLGNINPYTYVADNPVRFTDPQGLQHGPGGPWHPPSFLSIGCTWVDPCPLLSFKLNMFKTFLMGHILWDAANNPGRHSQEIIDIGNGLANCIRIHQEKCTNKCPNYFEVIPAPSPTQIMPPANPFMLPPPVPPPWLIPALL